MNSSSSAILSPCIGICEIAADGLCTGCLRDLSEIAQWSQLSDSDRLHLMDQVLPERESRRR